MNDNFINVKVACPFCGKISKVLNLDKASYNKWKCGEVIQKAFPKLSSTQREMLITGMCEECQNLTFG